MRVDGSGFERFIKGNINGRFDYEVKDVLATFAFPASIDPQSRSEDDNNHTELTMPLNFDFVLTQDDIKKGNNQLAAQYSFKLFEENEGIYPDGFVVGRDTRCVQTYIMLSKIP